MSRPWNRCGASFHASEHHPKRTNNTITDDSIAIDEQQQHTIDAGNDNVNVSNNSTDICTVHTVSIAAASSSGSSVSSLFTTATTTPSKLAAIDSTDCFLPGIDLVSTSASLSGDVCDDTQQQPESIDGPAISGHSHSASDNRLDDTQNNDDAKSRNQLSVQYGDGPTAADEADHDTRTLISVESGERHLEDDADGSFPVQHIVDHNNIYDDANTVGIKTVSTLSVATSCYKMNETNENGPHPCFFEGEQESNPVYSSRCTNINVLPLPCSKVPSRGHFNNTDVLLSGYAAEDDSSYAYSVPGVSVCLGASSPSYNTSKFNASVGGDSSGNGGPSSNYPCTKLTPMPLSVWNVSLIGNAKNSIEDCLQSASGRSSATDCSGLSRKSKKIQVASFHSSNKTSMSYMQMLAAHEAQQQHRRVNDHLVDLDVSLDDTITAERSNEQQTTKDDATTDHGESRSSHRRPDILSIGSSGSMEYRELGGTIVAITEVDQAMRRGTTMAYRADQSVMGTKDYQTIDTGSQKGGSSLRLATPESIISYDVVATTKPLAVDRPKRNAQATMHRNRRWVHCLVVVLISLILAAVAGGTACLVTGFCKTLF